MIYMIKSLGIRRKYRIKTEIMQNVQIFTNFQKKQMFVFAECVPVVDSNEKSMM